MSKDYQHLTSYQRCQIYTLKKRGDSPSTIANELGIHRSTIYRELSRNIGLRGYRFKQANEKAVRRRSEASHRKSKMTSEVIALTAIPARKI